MTRLTQRIVILGAGTAGTIMANRLARRFRKDLAGGRLHLTVVDQDDRHVYQPGLLFLPFGLYSAEELARPRGRQVSDMVTYIQCAIERVDADADVVHLTDGRALAYDVLIIATGTRLAPEETEGMLGEGWRESVFDFYTVEGADLLRRKLAAFEGGRLVINMVDMPIKCPVAPLEFAFLADWHFTERGIRNQVEITYVTPLDGAFTKPVAGARLGSLLAEKNIRLVTEFATGTVDGAGGRLVSYDEREVPFDLLVTIPLHAGAEFLKRTPNLADANQFVLTDPKTLQSTLQPNIFALGDATNLPTSKAGSVVHFQAELLEENIARYLDGLPPRSNFDGHANCFVETGHRKALLIDFNYDVEPLPGRFPLPVVGPMALLKESRLNHLGKLAFRWVYWNVLLPGHDIPGVAPRMSLRGKQLPDGMRAPVLR